MVQTKTGPSAAAKRVSMKLSGSNYKDYFNLKKIKNKTANFTTKDV